MITNQPVRKVENDIGRRWLFDDYFDVIIWYEPNGKALGLQLCYDKKRRERALTWRRDRGFVHTAVDSGEASPLANRTPILVTDGEFPAEIVKAEFIARSRSLPSEICDLVLERIAEYQRQVTPNKQPLQRPGNG